MANEEFGILRILQEGDKMEPTEQGQLLAAIGAALAEDVIGDADGAFLYAEVEPGVVAPSIYKDVGDRVVYSFASSELADRLTEAWESLAPSKRWSAISYTITGERFSVDFEFPDEFDSAAGSEVRLQRVLKSRFGNKIIDYSTPLPDAYK
jgi:hypothetical protein